MHKRIFVALLALLLLGSLSACASGESAQPRQDDGHAVMSADDSPTHTAVGTISTAPAPTWEEAQRVALAHAGLTAEEVTGLHTEQDYENGRAVFDVSFYRDGWEYDYEIDAETLEIISWEQDKD